MALIKGAGGIILKGNHVLLIKRKNAQIFNNLWANPGGKLEPWETVEECVVREVFEETGVAVKVVKKIVDYEDYRDDVLRGVYTGFLVVIVSGEANIREPEKFSKMGWFALDALPQPLAPFTLHYLKALNDNI